jgi:hypothetical protein
MFPGLQHSGLEYQMRLFDGMDRKLFAGAFLLAWYVAYKSMGLL